MEINGEHRFAAPRSAVFEALLDPVALQAAMPGCERFEEVGPGSFDVTIRVGISGLKGSYTGNVQVADRVEGESYRLVVGGSGKPGSLQGDATMVLSEDRGKTLVRYTGEVQAQGAIARLGSRLLSGAATLMIGQFFKNMENQVAQRIP